MTGNCFLFYSPCANVSVASVSNQSSSFFKKWAIRGLFFLFSLFLSFQYTVDSKQMFNINKFLPMTGFEPRTSDIGSNCSTN